MLKNIFIVLLLLVNLYAIPSHVDKNYKMADWNFYVSGVDSYGGEGFYFWRNGDKYYFQYVNFNYKTTSTGICLKNSKFSFRSVNTYEPLKGQMTKDEIRKLKNFISKIDDFKECKGRKNSKRVMGRDGIIYFSYKNGNKKQSDKFYYKEDKLCNEKIENLYRDLKPFQGKKGENCQTWSDIIPIRVDKILVPSK